MSQKKQKKLTNIHRFSFAVIVSCLVSIGLLSTRIIITGSERFIFMYWNLLLAIVPLLLAIYLLHRIQDFGWLQWQQIALTVLWLLFLPNSFYLLTDMVHLSSSSDVSLFYDIVMFSSFMVNGIILGFSSLYILHKQLLKKLTPQLSFMLVSAVLLLSSFAVFLGRFSRFNSWDIFFQPAGLVFDVSDRFVNPGQHFDTSMATIALFIVLTSIYLVIYNVLHTVKR